MKLKQLFVALLVLITGAVACADEMPVTGTYVPSDCPPCQAATESGTEWEPADLDEEGELLVEEVAFDEEMVFAAQAPDPALEVGTVAEEGEEVGEPTPPTRPGAKIDLNNASAAELTTLSGVGPALAGRIIDYREKRAFEKPTDVMRVRGIGPAKFEKLRDQITIAD